LIAQHSFHAQKKAQRAKRLRAPLLIPEMVLIAISLGVLMDQPDVQPG
jgi:hypothetical protein